jgi:hypothetical protein
MCACTKVFTCVLHKVNMQPQVACICGHSVHACSVDTYLHYAWHLCACNICSMSVACIHACVACTLHATCTQCVSLACLQHTCECSICGIYAAGECGMCAAWELFVWSMHTSCVHTVYVQQACGILTCSMPVHAWMWKLISLHIASEWQVCSACAACIRQVCDMCMVCLVRACRVYAGRMSQACGVCMTCEVVCVQRACALHRHACGAHAACLRHLWNVHDMCMWQVCGMHTM